jgi:glycosyltransferase involved in cell wall biosynthesis
MMPERVTDRESTNLRVTMLSKACLVGTYQRKLEELARLPGLELTVLVPPSWRSEQGTTRLERAYTRGYQLHVIPILLNGHFHLHFYPTLGHPLHHFSPHVLHIDEEPYNLATFLAVRAARKVGAVPLLFTWQNILRHYPAPFCWMEQYVLDHVGYALAGNAEARQVLRAKGYRGPCRVIPQFGVDPEIYRPRSHAGMGSERQGSGKRPFTIGYVGRLVAEKSVDLLLHAVARLKGEWRLRILGDGPERQRLFSLASELEIAPLVTFQSMITSTRMPDFYPQLDALVLPSRTRPNWKEQFGRVLIEAMACGVPVVGSDSGEIPHVVGETGMVFPEGDVAALRSILSRLQADDGLRDALAHRGRARVLAHYTQAHIAAATYEVYQEMMRPSAAPSGS